MEVKIGVQFAPRELAVESTQTPEEVEQHVTAAVRGETAVFTLVDDKGRRVVIPADKIAYVEIAEVEPRRVGFAGP